MARVVKKSLVQAISEIETPMDFAIVGLGRVADAHHKFYRRLGHKVVAAAELSEETAGEEGKKLGIEKVFIGEEGYKHLLGLGLDGVSVCTPPFARRDIVSEFLDAGLAVLVETPLASSIEDAAHMIDHAGNKLTAMPYIWRTAYPFSKLKEAVSDGSWGELKEARFDERNALDYSRGDWRRYPEKGGGPVIDYMVHLINYLRYIFGEVEALEAEGEPHRRNPCVYEFVHVRFYFPNNAVEATHLYHERLKGRHKNYKPELEISCRFEEGAFVSFIDWNSPIYLASSTTHYPFFRLFFRGEEFTEYGKTHGSDEGVSAREKYETQSLWGAISYHRVIANFIDSLRGKTEPYSGLQDGLRDLKVAFAIRESIQSGRKVDIKY